MENQESQNFGGYQIEQNSFQGAGLNNQIENQYNNDNGIQEETTSTSSHMNNNFSNMVLEENNLTLQLEQNTNQLQGNTFQWGINAEQNQENRNNQDNHIRDDATSDTSDGNLQEELDMINGSDGEGDEKPSEANYRSKNEQPLNKNLLGIEESLEERFKRFKVEPEQIGNLEQIGVIEHFIGDFITVGSRSDKTLDLESLLFTQNRIPLGPIDDVFGQVGVPNYTILKDNFLNQRIANKEINKGDPVYIDPNLSKILSTTQINILKAKKGCDASNQFDEETLEGGEVEFSDDEKEENFHRSKKQPKKDAHKSRMENKKEMRDFQKKTMAHSGTVYTQNGAFIPQQQQQNINMFPQQQPMFQMNQFPQNQFQQNFMPMNGQMMPGQIQMNPQQNFPLFFNPMMGQNVQGFNQPMQGMMPNMQQYPPQQVFMTPNNNMFQYPSHNNNNGF